MLNYITVLMPQDLLTLCPNTYFFLDHAPSEKPSLLWLLSLPGRNKYRCSPAISCSWTTYLWTTIRQIPYRDSNRSPFHDVELLLSKLLAVWPFTPPPRLKSQFSCVFSIICLSGKKIPTTKLTLMKPWSRGQAQANESRLIVGGYMGQMAQLNTVFCQYPKWTKTLVSAPWDHCFRKLVLYKKYSNKLCLLAANNRALVWEIPELKNQHVEYMWHSDVDKITKTSLDYAWCMWAVWEQYFLRETPVCFDSADTQMLSSIFYRKEKPQKA